MLAQFPHHGKLQEQIALEEGKIVIRYDGDNCLAADSAMHGNPFHVVDLIGEIDLDHGTAIDYRAFLDACKRQAANAHRDTAHRRIAALQ